MSDLLSQYWPQLVATIVTVVLSPRAVRFARHLWTLQTKYDNAMEKITYLTGRNSDLKGDVDYYKELRHDSDSTNQNRSIPKRTPTHDW